MLYYNFNMYCTPKCGVNYEKFKPFSHSNDLFIERDDSVFAGEH